MSNQLPSLKNNPGTQREYETIYIVRPNQTNDQVSELNQKVKGIIENNGGKVLKVDNWGKRKLAYEVQKERRGIYLYWQYLANPDLITEFERQLRLTDSVIRHLTTKINEDVDPSARPSEADAEAFEKAANTPADEEDMYLSRGTQTESEEDSSEDSEEEATTDETDASDAGEEDKAEE